MKKVLILLTAMSLFSCQKENVKQDENIDSTEVVSINETGAFHFNMGKTKLTWTAYKTPDKVGVDGSFKEIEVTNTKTSDKLEDILEGAKFKINTSSVTTKNEERDAKIAKLFFENLAESVITGTFGNFENGVVSVEINMNEEKVNKDFTYTINENKITLNGEIDMLADFKANKGFDLLHEACAELHLQKTWTEVSIQIETELEK